MKNFNSHYACLFIMFFAFYEANAQSGLWDLDHQSAVMTTTTGDVGIGTTNPLAKIDIQYCGNLPGIMISRNWCGDPGAYHNYQNQPFSYDGMEAPIEEGSGTGGPGGPTSWTLPGHLSYNLHPYNPTGSLLPGQPPLIWAKTQNSPYIQGASGTHTTQFMVTPFGRTGINIEHPRATMDIKTLGGLDFPALIAGKQRGGSTDKTIHMQYVPVLSIFAYNKITQFGDQGIFFTDGGGADGANSIGSFILAPWAENNSSLVGGLRMDHLGNIEHRGELITRKVKVDAQWWPDFVFDSEYELMPLLEVKNYISVHKHLPNMPGQDSVISNGQDIGDLQKLQQLKIEELMLYAIIQEERIEKLEQMITFLEELVGNITKK